MSVVENDDKDIIMRTSIIFFTFLLGFTWLYKSDYMVDKLYSKAEQVNNYEVAALQLAKENRELKAQISKMSFDIQELKSQNNFLEIKLEKKKSRKRKIASIALQKPLMNSGDFVKQDIYKWNPSQLLTIGTSEFNSKNYAKASQYFHELITRYPKDDLINDEVLFQAGVSAYESGKHYDWANEYLSKLIYDHPSSKHFRGAKLWRALTHFRMGKKDQFYATVDEFRRKYRNTTEWKILSVHYDELTKKYKK